MLKMVHKYVHACIDACMYTHTHTHTTHTHTHHTTPHHTHTHTHTHTTHTHHTTPHTHTHTQQTHTCIRTNQHIYTLLSKTIDTPPPSPPIPSLFPSASPDSRHPCDSGSTLLRELQRSTCSIAPSCRSH